jgi:hypothetical protein
MYRYWYVKLLMLYPYTRQVAITLSPYCLLFLTSHGARAPLYPMYRCIYQMYTLSRACGVREGLQGYSTVLLPPRHVAPIAANTISGFIYYRGFRAMPSCSSGLGFFLSFFFFWLGCLHCFFLKETMSTNWF